MENLRILIGAKDFGKVLAVGVGDEYLPEIIPLHHLYDPFHPLAIQSVEDVIQ